MSLLQAVRSQLGTDNEPPRVPTGSLTEDELLGALANQRRVHTIRALATAEDGFELGALARRIAALDYDCQTDTVSSDQRKNVYVALYQSHLPKLAEAGIIDYDERFGLVTPGPNHAQAAYVLDGIAAACQGGGSDGV